MKKKLRLILLIDDDYPTNCFNEMMIVDEGVAEEVRPIQWEFLEEYKKLPEYQRGAIVVVMLTASPNPDDEHKAGTLPSVSGFLNKPLTPETLHRVLRENFLEYIE